MSAIELSISDAVQTLIVQSPVQTVVVVTESDVQVQAAEYTDNVTIVENVNTVACTCSSDELIIDSCAYDETLLPARTSDTLSETTLEDMSAGMPVYITSGGNLGRAAADGMPQAAVIGLTLEAGQAGRPVSYVTDGRVTLTDWSGVTGTQYLERGQIYYLSAQPGRLTTDPPAAPASAYALSIGRSAGESMLDVEIGQPIKLL